MIYFIMADESNLPLYENNENFNHTTKVRWLEDICVAMVQRFQKLWPQRRLDIIAQFVHFVLGEFSERI